MTSAPTLDRKLAEFAIVHTRPAPAEEQIALRWIPISAIRVDPSYQRKISARGSATIKKIIAGFSWAHFGALSVVARDPETFAVIDGQHRTIAALLLGVQTVPAVVVTDDEIAAEARSFVSINATRTSVSTADKFRARVTAEDPQAVELAGILENLGINYDPPPGPLTSGKQTRSIVMLEKMLNKHGAGTLFTALETLTDAQAEYPDALRSVNLRAVTELTAAVIAMEGDIDRLAGVVEEADFEQLGERAASLRKIKGGQKFECLQELLIDLYNKGLRYKLGENVA